MIGNYFPDPREIIDPDGLVLINDEISVEILYESYSKGIFPWPHDELPILWFCPPERGVLFFDQLHISRSLRKYLLKQNWKMTVNKSFNQVIENCAVKKRKDQNGTWITDHMINNYKKFHKAGFAHSIECWNENSKLIGGLYGVLVDGIFSGESMFFLEANASKACLLTLAVKLQKHGLSWMDIQMVTPLLKSFGGSSISRGEFLELHAKSKKNNFSMSMSEIQISELIKTYY